MQKIIIALVSIMLAFLPLPKVQPIEKPVPVAQVVIEEKIETVLLQPLDNETIAWNFLIANGFSENQTAGIMGNLRQEHNFETSDVYGGLGIAQWIGGRRDGLMARENYLDINVQLQYMLDELNSYELSSKIAVLNSTTVEEATVAFQNRFERCSICRESTRIQYAYEVLAKFNK